MKTSFINNSIINGASVIGQSHLMNNTCNQDHYSVYKKKYGVALSVCDGVGSNKYSKYGSIAASKAVNKVFCLYHRNKIKKEDLGATIEKYYKKYVRKKYKNAAGTTCLFALIYDNCDVLFGQAGDGVILIKLDNKFIVFQNKTDDFINEVNALNCKNNFSSWKIRNLKFDSSINNRLYILLSTDGISEDIIPEKREDFLEYFISMSESNADKRLKDILINWDVPGSIDDKTLITFAWRQ